MLNNVKILSNVYDKNMYQEVKTINLTTGTSPFTVYVQLFQGDLGIRFIPESGATITINFLRGNTVASSRNPVSQTVSKVMSNPFAEDQSIFSADLTDTDIDKIVDGGFQVVVDQPTQGTITLFKKFAVTKNADPATVSGACSFNGT